MGGFSLPFFFVSGIKKCVFNYGKKCAKPYIQGVDSSALRCHVFNAFLQQEFIESIPQQQ
jgi:hypothetical protein